VEYDNKIIIIGGESKQPKAHNNVEAFDPVNQRWSVMPSLITGRHGSQAIVYKNRIFIATGSGNQGGSPELNSMEAINAGSLFK
jgi:N-acetylneuraminic acid mutarotase